MPKILDNAEAMRLLHSGGVRYVLQVPKHSLPKVIRRLTSCIEHDHTHVFVVDQSGGGTTVRVGVSEHGHDCVAPILGIEPLKPSEPVSRPVNRYPGPDRDFGEHDDYRVGDEVWTYDNAPGMVVFVRPAVPGDPDGKDYNVEGPNYMGEDYRVRNYDHTRLALVRRKS